MWLTNISFYSFCSVLIRGVQYVLSMMRVCIMVKVGESHKTKKNENRGKFINFAEIGGIWNMHLFGYIGLKGWTPLAIIKLTSRYLAYSLTY